MADRPPRSSASRFELAADEVRGADGSGEAALATLIVDGEVWVGDTGGMRLETVLLELLIAEDGPVAQECVRWLVEGTSPVRLEVDVASSRSAAD